MMTYIEQRGWCSSLISSTMCPSNVGKSTKPCPILSSSLASTSLISNSDSISLSTDSISSSSSLSYGKRTKTSTSSIVRSSLGQPNDYYTTKRIEELHERMDDIQISSFLKFINHHLSLKKDNDKIHINDLSKDLSNGHVLIDLIEILSSTKLKRERGRTRFHSLTNVQYVLDYLKLRMQHINISPHDIVSGNRKQILALLWIIMKTFDFPGFRITNKNCFVENTLLGFGQDRSVIIKWLNNILNQSLHTIQTYIKDFYIQTWINGYYFSIIIKYLIPLSIKYLTAQCFDYLKELDNVNPSDEQRFRLCVNLSNYCFNTITIIDYTDKSERCLFRYFSELQQNILNIVKTNHIGKLIQNNPYTKQILDTVIQTTTTTKTEHSSHIINNNEQYLICIEDDNQQLSAVKHTKLAMNSLGHSTSSSDDTDESANLRTVEKSRLFSDKQQKEKLKRKNRWEETKNLQSESHVINGHSATPKEEQVAPATNKSQQLNGTAANTEPAVLSVAKIEQDTNNHAKSSVTIQDLKQCTPTVEQTEIVDKKINQTTLLNQLNGKLEQVQQPVLSNEENKQFTNDDENSEEINQCIKNEVDIATNEKSEEAQQRLKPIEESHELVTSHKENKQFSDENETSPEETEQSNENKLNFINIEQPTAAIEEQKQHLPFNEKVEIEPSTTTENQSSMNIDKKPEQSVVESKQAHQPITSNEIECEKSVVNKPSTSTNEESLQLVVSNPEAPTTPTETNEMLGQPITEESSQVILSTEKNPVQIRENNTSIPISTNKKTSQSAASSRKNKKNAVKLIDNKASITSNDKLEQSIVKLDTIKSDQTPVPIEETKQLISNKPSTFTKKKLEQSIIVESPQNMASGEKTTVTLVENHPSNVTNKKSETPKMMGSQQSNGEVNQSTTANKKSTATNKKPTQITSPNKEPEQQKTAADQQMQTVVTISNADKSSDIINMQSLKVNNESVQAKAPLENQEHSIVSKKKVTSSTMSLESPKQTLKTAEETEQVPFKSITTQSEQSEVSLEKQEQSIIVKEEPCASAKLNCETKKPSTKTKKSNRSNAKKGKSENSPVSIEYSHQPILNNEQESDEEKIVPSLSPLHLTNIVQEQKPSIIVPEIQTSPPTSSNTKLLNNDENPPNSSALRSRKNKKKKTIATTTTTLIEKPSSPSSSATTTNHNLLVNIQECIRDRKIIAFKCVFILACLCFSIIIIVLSQK